MKTVLGAMSVLGALAVLIAGSSSGHAQVNGFTGIDPNFVGMDHGMEPKCPPMNYHVVVKNKNQLEGAAFTTGADGMELYTVSGALAADRKTVTMALKPVGVGKPTVIQGTYTNGMLMLKTTSGSCHVDEFMMMPVLPPARAPYAGGN